MVAFLPGIVDDCGREGSFLVGVEFATETFAAIEVTVVGSEDDEGIVGLSSGFQALEDASNGLVYAITMVW